jgi:hypothetical protein
MMRLIDHFLPSCGGMKTDSGRQRQRIEPVAVQPEESVDSAGSFYFRVTRTCSRPAVRLVAKLVENGEVRV